MLKIYLDWNIITQIEERHPQLLELLKGYNHLFVFPYTIAHIRDIVHSSSAQDSRLKYDLDMLSAISGKHFLSFENDIMQPLFVTPNDYFDECGVLVSLIQNTKLISKTIYNGWRSNSIKHIKDKDSSLFQAIEGAEPDTVFVLIDKYFEQYTQWSSCLDFVNDYLSPIIRDNNEAKFKMLYFILEYFGFRKEEKKKEFNNIDTDASHMFHAAHCDCLVTADGRMNAKSEAVYKYLNIQTEAITPDKLEQLILEEINKEYNLAYIADCINTYGVPRMEGDKAHYKLMRTPVLGLFNTCFKLPTQFVTDSEVQSAVFKYSFNNTPYLFYTEMERFFHLFRQLIPESQKEVFEKDFVQPMISQNKDIADRARFHFEVEDIQLSILLLNDFDAVVPCPMMQITHGPLFKELAEKLQSKSIL